jgi:hypothetical protein
VTDDDLAMSDLVLFELPTRSTVERFCAALRPQWRGWSTVDGDVWLVAAELRPRKGDVATLLREAQAAIADLGLPTITFCLDDRLYSLEARPREAASAPPPKRARPRKPRDAVK